MNNSNPSKWQWHLLMFLGLVFVVGAICCDQVSKKYEPQLIQVLTGSQPRRGELIFYEMPMFHFANNVSAKMLSLGLFFILSGGLQNRHIRLQSKLKELELQIETLTKKEKSA